MPRRARTPTVPMTIEGPKGRTHMPRYLVERTFSEALAVPAGAEGAEACRGVIERNELEGVTWLHSYVSEDRTKTFCIYDGPSPKAIRKSATDNDLPVDAMTEV